MKGSLSSSPLCLSLTSPIIFLSCESSLCGWLQENLLPNEHHYAFEVKKNDRVYLILEKIIPGFACQCISNDELEDIQRNIEDNAVDPDNTGPSPSYTFDSRKAPICIDSNQSSNLKI